MSKIFPNFNKILLEVIKTLVQETVALHGNSKKKFRHYIWKMTSKIRAWDAKELLGFTYFQDKKRKESLYPYLWAMV